MSVKYWPLPLTKDGRKPRITSGYGYSEARGYKHRGVDILYPRVGGHSEIVPGTLALAVLPGVVTKAQLNYENFAAWAGRALKDKSTGYVVEIDHGGGLKTAAHHLSSASVRVGQLVAAGATIGVVGGSPNKLGSKPGVPGIVHLHWDVIKDGLFVDGKDYLGGSDYLPWPNVSALAFIVVGAIVFFGLRRLRT